MQARVDQIGPVVGIVPVGHGDGDGAGVAGAGIGVGVDGLRRAGRAGLAHITAAVAKGLESGIVEVDGEETKAGPETELLTGAGDELAPDALAGSGPLAGREGSRAQ